MNSGNFLLKIEYYLNEAFVSQDPELLDTVFEIKGKKLYADKLRLSVISPMFKTMLSDRWNTNKNEPIKITNYEFDDFKYFVSFIYSGNCMLNDSNMFTMLDMAEFYQVADLKDLCDAYLARIEPTFENVNYKMEMSNKYSLIKMRKKVQYFVSQNFKDFVKKDSFFKCDKSAINEVISLDSVNVTWEDKFQAIYEWSEHQALKHSNNENFNRNDVIKATISGFLPSIQFKKMKPHFLIKYVVKKANFLFSGDELSDILDSANSIGKVIVTNSNGKILSGTLPNYSEAIEIIQSLKNCPSANGSSFLIYWYTYRPLPLTPSSLKKRDGVEWYLIYYPSGNLGVKHSSDINDTNYLLAEMSSENGDFEVSTNCEIKIV